jgi:hypothetical protein
MVIKTQTAQRRNQVASFRLFQSFSYFKRYQKSLQIRRLLLILITIDVEQQEGNLELRKTL